MGNFLKIIKLTTYTKKKLFRHLSINTQMDIALKYILECGYSTFNYHLYKPNQLAKLMAVFQIEFGRKFVSE